MNRCGDCDERIPVDCGGLCPSCANDRAAEDWAEFVEDRRREWDDTAYEPPMTGAIYRHRHERRDIA